MSTEEN
jgi:predicted ester cyclase